MSFHHLSSAHGLCIISPDHGDDVLEDDVQPEGCNEEREVCCFADAHWLVDANLKSNPK